MLIIDLLIIAGLFCVPSLKITGSADVDPPPASTHYRDDLRAMNERSLAYALEKNEDGVIWLDSMIPVKEARSFAYEFYAKYPELTLSYSPKCAMSGYDAKSDYCIGYNIHYLSEDGGRMRYEELISATEPLMEEIKDKSDREKIKETVRWIKDNSIYSKNPHALWSGSLYGCLVKGEATCLGFSEAFFYIMDTLDIPCSIECTKYHAWNLVYDGEKWVKVDLTRRSPME